MKIDIELGNSSQWFSPHDLIVSALENMIILYMLTEKKTISSKSVTIHEYEKFLGKIMKLTGVFKDNLCQK